MQWWHAQRLKSNNPKTRRAAVEKLAEHPSADAFALLAPVLQDSDPEVRKSAARALGRLREPKAIPYLLHSLQDPVSEVRAGIVIALREIGDTRATEGLVQTLSDKDPVVRSQAAKTLERFGWTAQSGKERMLRDSALGHFVDAAKAGLPILEVLIKTLAEGTPTNKRGAIEALGNMGGEEALSALLGALEDKDCTVRVAALEVLKHFTDPCVIPPLVTCLKHGEAAVRAAAATALAPHGNGPEASVALIRCLKDRSWSVRKAVVEALGRTRDASLTDTLVPLLKDTDHDVREVACEALGRIKAKTAVTHLVLALTDSQTSVRQLAAGALRDIDLEWERFPEAHAALPQLKQALNDREYWVRQAAREAIQRIEVAQQFERRVKLMDEKLDAALDVVQALLKHSHRDLRQAAVEAIARFNDPLLQPLLASANSDEDPWVRESAAKAATDGAAPNGHATTETAPVADVWGAAA